MERWGTSDFRRKKWLRNEICTRKLKESGSGRGVLFIASGSDSFRQKPPEPARQPHMSSTAFSGPEHRRHLAMAFSALAIRLSIAPGRREFRQKIDEENPEILGLEWELLEIQSRLGYPDRAAERPRTSEGGRTQTRQPDVRGVAFAGRCRRPESGGRLQHGTILSGLVRGCLLR